MLNLIAEYFVLNSNARLAIRTLFTPTERRYPFLMFFAPGLLITNVLTIFCAAGLGVLRVILVPTPEKPDPQNPFAHVNPVKFGIYLGIAVLSVVILNPLFIINVRVSIQRNHSLLGYGIKPEDNVEPLPDILSDSVIQ